MAEVSSNWLMAELDRRYRVITTRYGIAYEPLDIPYLRTEESTALLEAELRIHLTDTRIWDGATPLIYRHLMRSGLSPEDIGAILGRTGHTVRAGAASYRHLFVTYCRLAREHKSEHGYSQVTEADLDLAEGAADHIETQTRNKNTPLLNLNPRLFI